jgi:hypothetical protein
MPDLTGFPLAGMRKTGEKRLFTGPSIFCGLRLGF